LVLHQLHKRVQLIGVQIRDRPVGHPGLRPVDLIIALAYIDRCRRVARLRRRPAEQIDGMALVLVHQCRDRPAIKIIEPTAGQRISLAGQIVDHR
jgi:hypothetical protein